MALLQGFPPDYHFEGPLTAKYNQIGDAVPPMISVLVARQIARVQTGMSNLERELAARDGQYLLTLKEQGALYMTEPQLTADG